MGNVKNEKKKKKQLLSNEATTEEAVNPVRRKEKADMLAMGFKTKKQYRKWQKKQNKKNLTRV